MVACADLIQECLRERGSVMVLVDLIKMRNFLKSTETLHCGVPTAARDNKQSSSGAANLVIIF